MSVVKRRNTEVRLNSMPLIYRLGDEPRKMGLEKQSVPGSPVSLNVPLWSIGFIL